MEKFKKYLEESFQESSLDLEKIKEESPQTYNAITKAFTKYQLNELLSLEFKLKVIGDQEWLKIMITYVYFYKMSAKTRGLMIQPLMLRVLVYYVKYGLGENSKNTRALVRRLENITDKELNSLNKTLRDKGLLFKGEFKESNNELCKELEQLRKYYIYMKGKGEKVSRFKFSFIDNNS